MFEGKPLPRLTYANLDGFLHEGNEEGTHLDYEQEAVSDEPRIYSPGGSPCAGERPKNG